MAMGARPAPLMVPDAELLAKNMRAEALLRRRINDGGFAQTEQHRTGKRLAVVTPEDYEDEITEPEPDTHQQQHVKKFGPAKDEEEGPGFTEKLTMWLGLEKDDKWGKAVWPILEKGAAAVSKLPKPTIMFLTIVWGIMLVSWIRKSLLDFWLVSLGLTLTMIGVVIMSFLWGKTELFASLREGTHQTKAYPEEKLDGLENELKEREAKVKVAEEELQKRKKQLELLKKELDLDPVRDDEQRVVKPSKKAVEIIAEGALGKGYDAEDAEAAGLRKRNEAVLKSRETWRMRPAELEDNSVKDQIRKHTATIYKKRTKELKSNANVQKAGGVLTVAGGLRLPFANSKEKKEERQKEHEVAQPHPILDVPSSTSFIQSPQQRNSTDASGEASFVENVSHNDIAEPTKGSKGSKGHEGPIKKLKRKKSGLKKILSYAARRNSHASDRDKSSEAGGLLPAATT